MKLLDHGSLDPVESWGSDERIIESARMSTQGGFVSWEPIGTGLRQGEQFNLQLADLQLIDRLMPRGGRHVA